MCHWNVFCWDLFLNCGVGQDSWCVNSQQLLSTGSYDVIIYIASNSLLSAICVYRKLTSNTGQVSDIAFLDQISNVFKVISAGGVSQ